LLFSEKAIAEKLFFQVLQGGKQREELIRGIVLLFLFRLNEQTAHL